MSSRIMNVANPVTCFVCSQKVTGEKVNLASSVATHSKVTLPEKISQLIGDDYVVAVTEQDCACKRCASLLNHMDKLENELTLVKRALTLNISNKYKINFNDGQLASQVMTNGNSKTDSASDYEDEARKINPELSATSTPQAKKKLPQPNKIVATPKPAKPPENVTKLKIYKCGFCSYQSKELSNVRLHMKIHIRTNKSDNEGDKVNAVASPLLAPKNPMSVRRRVFRCQVCSASFDDRNKCLEHISRDHTAAGRKLVEQKQSQDEQPQPNVKTDDQVSDSTVSQVNDAPSHPNQGDVEAAALPSDDLGSQEEMDTTEPSADALYSSNTCPTTLSNDVEFATQVTEQIKSEDANNEEKLTSMNTDDEPSKTEPTFSQVTSGDNQGANDEGTPKDSNMGLDIEAMIAALHSEGPENANDSMPSI